MRKNVDILDGSNSRIKVIWYLAWPVVLEQLLLTLVQYVDTAMVGSLGTNATAAVAVTSSTGWLVNGLFTAAGVGFGVLIGQAVGAREYDRAREVTRQGITGALILGLTITLIAQIIAGFLPGWLGADPEIRESSGVYFRIVSAAYCANVSVTVCSGILRCEGDTRTPLFYNIATNLINIALNFLLIYQPRTVLLFGKSVWIWGAGLGVEGAAIASAIAMAFSGIMLARTLFSQRRELHISTHDDFRPKWDICRQVLRLGTPVALERAILSTGQIVLTALITGISTEALAAHHLAITAEAMTYMPAYGLSAAATTLVAQCVGAKKYALAVKYSRACLYAGLVFMCVMGVVLYISAETLLSFFTPVAGVILLGGAVLRIEAFAQPFNALSMVVSGALRGNFQTRWSFYINAVGMWIVRLSIAFVLLNTTDMGLYAVWYAMVIDLGVRGVLSVFALKKQNRMLIKLEEAQNI